MKRAQTVDVDFGAGNSLVLAVPTAAGMSRHDLIEELAWRGTPDSNEVLEEHAGREAWWSARHVDEAAIAAQWIETVYEPYMAHLRRFATYVLIAQGTRRKDAALRDISDMVYQLYSETRAPDQRQRIADQSFLGYMIELFESRAVVQRLAQEDKAAYDAHYAAFMADIFAYQQGDDLVWVEEAVRRRIQMERSRDLLGAAMQAFRDRGYLLRQSAENEKARRNAMGGVQIEELAKRVAEILRK